MSESTRRFWKGFVRTSLVALTALLILVVIELLLTYKHAHDHPELYVAESTGVGEAWREGAPGDVPAAEAPPAMAPARPAQPGAGGRRPAMGPPGRPGAAPQVPPQDRAVAPRPNQGAGSDSPGLLSFPQTRGRIATFFAGGGGGIVATNRSTNSGNQATNAPVDSVQTNKTSQAVAKSSSGDGRAGYLAPRVQWSGQRGLASTNGFRFAVP